jgi:hypothetical protein
MASRSAAPTSAPTSPWPTGSPHPASHPPHRRYPRLGHPARTRPSPPNSVPPSSMALLPTGAALPTVEQLAATHHVAPSTAHRAITVLANEHLVTVSRGSRAIANVCPLKPKQVPGRYYNSLSRGRPPYRAVAAELRRASIRARPTAIALLTRPPCRDPLVARSVAHRSSRFTWPPLPRSMVGSGGAVGHHACCGGSAVVEG